MGDGQDQQANSPGLSVVIPCFNQAPYIRACVESVLSQNSNLEIILVDDGSTDDSSAIVRGYAPRVRLIRQANGGPSVARNTGFAASTGSLVCFLDGDDMLCPGFADSILACAGENPSADVLVSSWRILEPDGKISRPMTPLVTNDDAFHSWLRQGWGPPMCFTVRREMLDAVGPFDPDRRIMGNEDWDMWLRVAAADAHFQECFAAQAVYRVTAGSVSSNAVRQWKSRRLVLAKAMALHKRCLKCRLAAIANGPNYVDHVILPRIANQSNTRLLSLAYKAPGMSVPLARAVGRRFVFRLRVSLGKVRRRLLGPGV